MKPIFLFLFFLFLTSNIIIAQNDTYVDSLKVVFESSKEVSEKVKTSNLMFIELRHKNPTKALKYARTTLSLSKKNRFKKGEGIAYRNLGYYYRFKPNVDSSRYYFEKSFNTLKSNNDIPELIDTIEEYAIFECMQGDYKKAIRISEQGFEYSLQIKSSPHMLMCLNRMTAIHTDSGNFEAATNENLKAFKVLDTSYSKNKFYKLIALVHNARIEMLRGNYKISIPTLNEAIAIAKELNESLWMAINYNEIGNAYWYLKEYDNAINAYNKSLKICKKIKRNDFVSIALSNIASIQTEQGNYNKAIKTLKACIQISEKIGAVATVINDYNLLGSAYLSSGQLNNAILCHTKAIKLSDSIKSLEISRDGYKSRSHAYEEIGNFKAALKDLNIYVKLNDSINSTEVANRIEELKTKYETEKKEAQIALQDEEIKTLNIQAKNDNLSKTLYSIGMFSFFTIAGLLYFGFKQRIKKNQIEREKQETIYKQEIAFKKKELTSQTLHLVQKNTFIQELKENLEKIKQSPELFKVEFRRLVMLLKKESAEDKDWEVFKSYFSEVHNNFDNKLKAIYTDITEKEIRLASFLRMNLSTKEIASMLNVLPDSVLKSKYRLKKKLKLDKEVDLGNFLNDL